ncbi:acetyl esterase/lipase [Glaciihabitans tibetensis]|uniref:Acetyl esterase/lipase n=1 Tax=Glaciihabitans tibetensis TaxID=1266600 RepID=A0A2T0V2C6_9MICO|nr:alpha/beta hydrolase [Glaciihabitans tibetensis]PRY64314.1 acetyl esterase/lipase [Glaciihabitans tibetensis]
MPLDPYLAGRVRGIPTDPSWNADRSDPDNAPIYAEFFTDPAPYELPVSVDIRDDVVFGPHGPVPVRIYRAVDAIGLVPALLWNHGGGFAGGDLDMNESHVASAELAARSGALVVSVGYRLATDGVRYPVPLDDVEAAWLWLVASAAGLGVDSRRIAIGGGSAGANLAAATVVRLRNNASPLPTMMLLAYPALHFPLPALEDDVQAVMATLPQVLRASAAAVTAMFANYAGRISDLPAEVTPGHADLRKFPATRILISEYDDFRPSGELFAEQLAEVGVPVETRLSTGMLHGHLNRTPALPEVSRSLDYFAAAFAPTVNSAPSSHE